MTSSPSNTNCFGGKARIASATSGKYRASGCPAFDCNWTSRPSRNARQRNPSHFGSYCHSAPSGIASTDNASIGAKGGWIGNAICSPGTIVQVGACRDPRTSVYLNPFHSLQLCALDDYANNFSPGILEERVHRCCRRGTRALCF